MSHLVKNIRIHRVFDSSGMAKKSTALYGRAIQMAGFEGCCFIAIAGKDVMGASTDKAYMKIQASSATGGTFNNLYGSSSTGASNWTSANTDYKLLVTDVYKPLSTQLYLRPILCGTSTGNFGGVLAIQYGPRLMGSSDVWKSSTRGGSTRWDSTRLGAQVVCISATATTATTG